MKIKKLHFVLFLSGFFSYSQQAAQYTQYMYNPMSINPAYAGSRGVLSIFGLHRTQWVGLDGAPETNSLAINTPLGKQIGGGLSFLTDKIGPIVESSVSADVSYTIQTSENYKLSFGVKGTLNLFDIDPTKLNSKDFNDLVLQNIENSLSSNIGAGLYYYSENLYLGASIPNFFQNNSYDFNSIKIDKEYMNFYFIGGYVVDLSSNLKFKPAFMTKMIDGAPLQLDVSGNFLINDKFTIGAAWRWSAAVSAMAGFQISKGIYVGYGYDLETTKLANYNSGSHEIFLRFEFFKNTDYIVSPRFF
ncbi:PorP/SprF family type IX secretion system membrane protein [Flavobacterium sp. DSR3-2]|uniref:PorP/SprF family type IX secretion system membrane protein n=1 Tax=Flavobacterium sp. DSR3-2 TaxID=2804634 RepID=UPI003CF90338